MDNPRCKRCDRAECRREATWHAYAEADCTDAARELRDASCAAQVDCDAHVVDWRARCLRAEQAMPTDREAADLIACRVRAPIPLDVRIALADEIEHALRDARALAAEQAATTAREDERRRVGRALAPRLVEAREVMAHLHEHARGLSAVRRRRLEAAIRLLDGCAREAEQAGEAGTCAAFREAQPGTCGYVN